MGRSLLRSQPLTTGDLCLRSRDAERIPARGKAGEQGGRARAPGRRERGRGWKIESDDSSSSNDVESTVPFFFPLRGPPDADPLPSAPSSLALSHSLSLSPPLELFEAPPSSRLKQREYARFVSPFPTPPATLFVVAQVRDLSCAQGPCAHVRSKAERNRRGASNIRLVALLRSFHLTSPRSLANLASASLRLPRTPATSQPLSCTEVARGIREAGRSLCANGLFLSLHSLECSLCFPSLFLPSTSVSGLDSSPASNSPPPPPR